MGGVESWRGRSLLAVLAVLAAGVPSLRADDDDATLVYGSSTAPDTSIPQVRTLDDSAGTWSVGADTAGAADTIRWTVARRSALRDERLVAVLSKVGSTGSDLDLVRHDGTSWVVDWSSTAISNANAGRRGVDVEYEASSGEALVVYSNGTSGPVYRTWNGTVWSAETAVFGAAPGGGVVVRVELVARRGSNELTLLYADDASDLFAVVWDGSSWDTANVQLLETNLAGLDRQVFAGAYESLSGDLLAVWGVAGANVPGKYATRDFDATAFATTAWVDDIDVPVLAPDPASDRIAIGLVEEVNDVRGAMWDGSALVQEVVFDTFAVDANGPGDRMLDVGWVGASGTAVLVYRDVDAGSDLDWARWTESSGWVLQGDVVMAGIGELQSFQVQALTTQAKLLVAFTNDSAELYAATYDGASWSLTNGGVALESAVTSVDSIPFSFDVEADQRLRVADPRAGQEGDAFAGTGSRTDAELLGLRLVPTHGTVTVTQVVVTISDLAGLTDADWAGVELVVDANANGTIDGGETTTLFGAGVVNQAGGTITFATSAAISAATSLILRADFASLSGGDRVTISLAAAGITTSGSVPVDGATTSVVHSEGFTTLASGDDLRLLYGQGALATPLARAWIDAQARWSGEEILPATAATIHWIVNAVDPTGGEELALVLAGGGGTPSLDLVRFTGAAWVVDWTSAAIPLAAIDQRAFDLVLEAGSGDALAVYSTNGANPAFRTRSGGVWSGEANVFGGAPPGAGAIRWIELARRPGSDEVALVYADDNADLFAVVWNGSTWDTANAATLETDLDNVVRRTFDVAWESIGGDLLVAWAVAGANADGRYAVRRAGSVAFSTGTLVDDLDAVDLAADPSSDRIALAMNDEGNDVSAAMWDGAAWGETVLLDGATDLPGGNGDRRLAVGWVGASGTAVLVYRDTDSGNDLDWARWQAGVWALMGDAAFAVLGEIESVEVVPFTGQAKAMAVFSTSDSRLFAATCDGNAWTLTNSGAELEAALSSIGSMPFSAAVLAHRTVVVGAHPAGVEPDAFAEGGSQTGAELLGFRLLADQGPAITVNQAVFAIADVAGLTDADWANVRILVDADGNGTIDPGETTAVGGAGAVNQAAGTITFSTPFTVGTSTSYILVADFASLAGGDAVTVSLAAAGLTTAGGSPTAGAAAGSGHAEGVSIPGIDDVRVVYGEADLAALRTRIRTGSTGVLSPETSLPPVTGTVHWTVNRAHPFSNEELVAVLARKAPGTDLSLLRFDGTAWTAQWSALAIPEADADKRGFDLEYESRSGDALVVYSDGTANPVFRTRSGGAWSAPGPVFGAPPGAGAVLWVELARRPGSDEVALVYSDAASGLHAVAWNGAAWDVANATTLETAIDNTIRRVFDAEYETLSGDLLVVWAVAGASALGEYAVLPSGTTAFQSATLIDDLDVIDLAADPASDRIALVACEEGSQLLAGMWDGASWTDLETLDTAILVTGGPGDLRLGVAWAGSSGTCVLVYRDNDGGAEIDWARWSTGGGWRVQADAAIAGIGEIESIQLETVADADRVVLLLLDGSSAVHLAASDGNSWSVPAGGSPFETAASTLSAVPLSLAARSLEHLVIGPHPAGVEPDAFLEAGSATGAELFAFRMVPDQGIPVNVLQLVLSISDLAGLTDADWANVQLVVDDNGNGTLEAGEVTILGGAGVVNQAGGTITFPAAFPVTGPTDFVVRADFATLSAGDQATVDLSPANVTIAEPYQVRGAVPASGHREGPTTSAAGDLRLVHGEGTVAGPRTRLLSDATGLWSLEESLPPAGATIRWVVHRHHPTGPEELAAVLSRTETGSHLALQRFDGATWSTDWTSSALAALRTASQAVDVEYEAASGDALVVHGDDTAGPVYRTRVGGLWSAETKVFSGPPPGTGVVIWVELVRRPGTDEVTLLYADENSDLFAVTWTGAAWNEAAAATLETSLRTTVRRAFDGAYETASGDLLVAWGVAGGNSPGRYAVRLAGQAAFSTATLVDDVEFVDLAADPAGDRIALGAFEETDDVLAAVWDGGGWSSISTLDTVSRGPGVGADARLAVGWVGPSGTALLVYGDNDAGSEVDWALWTPALGWVLQADAALAVGEVDTYRIESFRARDEAVVAALNQDSSLFVLRYALGSGWTATNGGAALETDASSIDSRPFGLSIDADPILVLSTHPRGQTADAFGEGGGESGAELFALRLTPEAGAAPSVTQLVFSIGQLSGLTDADWANVRLVVDDDASGSIDPGETTVVGGAGAVSQAAGTITFSTAFAVSGPSAYVLVADFVSLSTGDRVEVSLAAAGVTTAGGVAVRGETVPIGHLEGTATLAIDEVRLHYGEGTARTPRSRIWRPGPAAWTVEESLPAAASTILWTVPRVHPAGTEELLGVLSRTSTTGELDLLRFDGTAWTVDWTSTGIAWQDARKRGFDLEYEPISGEALAVYSNGTSDPVFRTRSGGVWSAETNLFGTPPGSGVVLWVELATRTGTDEMALVYADDAGDLFAVLWDGTNWKVATATTLETALRSTDRRVFDACYESLSGDLLVVWGTAGTNARGAFAVKPSGTDVFTTDGWYDDVEFVDLAADPASDRIALVQVEETDDLRLAIWNGASWDDDVLFDTAMAGSGGPGDEPAAAGWVGASGRAVATYDDTDDTTQLDTVDWTDAAGWAGTDLAAVPPVKGSVVLESFTGRDEVFALYSSQGSLYAAHYDGTTWTLTNGASPLETGLSSHESVPFGAAPRSQPRLLVADPPAGLQTDAFGETGSAASAELLGVQLLPGPGASVNVSQLVFTVSEVAGLADADWSGIELVVDANRNGSIDGGEATAVGGPGTVNQVAGTITFSVPFVVSGRTDLILRATFASLSAGDHVQVGLSTAGVSTGGGEPVSGSVASSSHHEGVFTQFFDDARLVYGEASVPAARWRDWDDSAGVWSGEESLPATAATVRWTVHRVSPVTREEISLVFAETGSGTRLDAVRFAGIARTIDWSSTGAPRENAGRRGFDLEYEGVSGDALAVFTTTGSSPRYRTRSGGAWSAEASVFTTAPSTGRVLWVELERRPGTDEVALVYADENLDLFAVVWNGSSWLTASVATLETNLDNVDRRVFDLAYERTSGDLLAVWAAGGANVLGKYATKPAGSTTWTTSTLADDMDFVDLASDPGSDRIALGVVEEASEVRLAIWDGTSWVDSTTIEAVSRAPGGPGDQAVAVGWVGRSGRAVAIWNDDDDTTGLDTATHAGAGWVAADVPGIAPVLESVAIEALGDRGALLAVYSNDRRLYAVAFDGTTWTATHGGAALEGALSSKSSVAFSLDVARPLARFAGTVYQADGVTPLTGVALELSILVDGVWMDRQPIQSGTGAYANLRARLRADSVVTIFADDHASDGALVTQVPVADLAAMDLFVGRLAVRNDNGGATTNLELDTAHDGDADLAALWTDGTGTALSTAAGTTLHVAGTYHPDGNVTVGGFLHVAAGGTLRVRGGSTFALARAKGTFPPERHVVAGTMTIEAGNGTATSLRLGDHQQLVVDGTIEVVQGAVPLGFPGGGYVLATRDGASGGWSLWIRDGATATLEFVKFEYLYGRSSNSDEDQETNVESGLALSGDRSTLARLRVLWFDHLVDGGAPPTLDRYPRFLYLLVQGDADDWDGMGDLLRLHKLRFDSSSGPADARTVEKRAAGDRIRIVNGAGTLHGESRDMDGKLDDNVTGDPDARNTGIDDIEFGENPTAVELVDLRATGHDRAVVVEWRTGQEVDNLGFNVYRSLSPDRGWIQVNPVLVLGLGSSPAGGRYAFVDRTVENGRRYWYVLEDVDDRGERTLHGPVEAVPSAAAGDPVLDPSDFTSVGSTSDGAGPPAAPPGSALPGSGDGPGGSDLATRLLGLDLERAGIRLLSWDESGAVLEVLPPEPVLTPEVRGDRIETRIEMPGYSTTRVLGAPEVPAKGVLLVTPWIEEARVGILSAEIRATFRGLEPVRTLERGIVPDRPEASDGDEPWDVMESIRRARREIDRRIRERRLELERSRREARRRLLGLGSPDRAAAPAPGPGAGEREAIATPEPPLVRFPGELAALAPLVVSGGRQLQPIRFHPVQVSADGARIEVYRRLLVRVDFLGRRSPPSSGPSGPVVESEDQARLAADPGAVKVRVDADGLYALGRPELAAAGFDVAADPRSFRMYQGGREVAIRVEGALDGSFDATDRILFVGRRNPWRTVDAPEATIYTDQNVYWLTAGEGEGLRMEEVWVRPTGRTPAASHPAVRHHESNVLYFPRLADGAGRDHWFMARLFGTAGGSHPLSRATFELALPALASVPHTAVLEVAAAGVSDLPADPDHRLVVRVAGHAVGELVWDGRRQATGAFQVPSSFLVPGLNAIELELPADLPGAGLDSVLVNYVRLGYRAVHRAEDGVLDFAGEEPGEFEVAGFDGAVVLGVDASDPARPRFLRGIEVAAGRARFSDRAVRTGGRYRIVSSPAAVAGLSRNHPSDWRSASHGADWIGIAPRVLRPALTPLAEWRASRGLRAVVVDLEDVYDEFTAGVPDPAALRAFLARARAAWSGAPPRFVLLAGDGSFDSHGHQWPGSDLLPTAMVQTEALWTASDSAYAAVEGDDHLPDLALGRIPAGSAGELSVVVEKILAHERAGALPWTDRATLVADDADASYDFERATEGFASLFGPADEVEVLRRSSLGVAETRRRIRTAFDEGRFLVGYMGHGDVGSWAAEGLWTSADAGTLAPTRRAAFVTAMGCMNGMFHLPGIDSLGEALLSPGDRGARAFWGSTSLVGPTGQEETYRELARILGARSVPTLGEAVTEAILRAWADGFDDHDVVRSWVLLGDPAAPVR